MNLLSLPAEVLDMVLGDLNAPETPIMYWHHLPASTACLCKLDKIIAQDDKVYPIWRGWKRDSIATLTLRTDCNDVTANPRLADYVELFPNLCKIGITLIYPSLPGYERSHQTKRAVGPCKPQQTQHSGSTSRTSAPSSLLTSVSLTIHGSNECKGMRYESQVNTWVQKFRSSNQLGQVGITKLEHYHLELALGNHPDDEQYWHEILRRLSLACGIPANEVSICFTFTCGGEVERVLASPFAFAKVLALATTNWPSEIKGISFCLSLEDYSSGGYRDILDMVEIDEEDGSVNLVDGHLPSKTDMDRLVRSLRENRPHLQRFDLTMYVVNPGSPIQRKLFEYKYTAAVNAHLGNKMTGALRIKVDQAAVEDPHNNQMHAPRIDEIDIFGPNDDAEPSAASDDDDDDSEGSEEADEAVETVRMRWQALTMMMKRMSAAASLGFDEFDDDWNSWQEEGLMVRRETIYLAMMFIKWIELVVTVLGECDFDDDSDSGSDSDSDEEVSSSS
ncbi:hypothetical protein QFC21_002154 [Naganishia friedmannii]|uniref:Uncharacterized protein n=1 Tax=Naganishia friedmannii TaxID=89922 RepID=A0ACC2W0S7_9TREE|nr:hypothetical protein QFC21_002154 [Naganishia friedmannii]